MTSTTHDAAWYNATRAAHDAATYYVDGKPLIGPLGRYAPDAARDIWRDEAMALKADLVTVLAALPTEDVISLAGQIADAVEQELRLRPVALTDPPPVPDPPSLIIDGREESDHGHDDDNTVTGSFEGGDGESIGSLEDPESARQ